MYLQNYNALLAFLVPREKSLLHILVLTKTSMMGFHRRKYMDMTLDSRAPTYNSGSFRVGGGSQLDSGRSSAHKNKKESGGQPVIFLLYQQEHWECDKWRSQWKSPIMSFHCIRWHI